MSWSSTPLLLVVLLGWTARVIEVRYASGHINAAARRALWGLLLAWLVLGGVAIGLGLSGISISAPFLASYPLYWYPMLPVVVAMAGIMGSPALREGLGGLAVHDGQRFLLQVHLLRLLAIGGIVKAANGDFIAAFGFIVGGGDLLFALSAIVMMYLAARGRVSRRWLLVWNLAGALVILAPMLLLGPWFMQDARITTLFELPMLLAPALIVPILVSFNLLMVWQLMAVPQAGRKRAISDSVGV